jgi:hypothetical protein
MRYSGWGGWRRVVMFGLAVVSLSGMTPAYATERLTDRSRPGAQGNDPVVSGPADRVKGMVRARDWQHAGDLALANDQPLLAHLFYKKILETFPGTPHARYAARRLKVTSAVLRKPARSSAVEDLGPWVGEFMDLVTWP